MAQMNQEKIRVAIIIGHHAFDVPGFWNLFRNMSRVEYYPQTLSNFGAGFGNVSDLYNVVLFYNYHQSAPGQNRSKWDRIKASALECLVETERGIVLLHHGLLAFPGWELWSNLSGLSDRRFRAHLRQRIRIEIANPYHPITRGVSAWEMTDETYSMESAGPGCEILLTTDNPKSMRTIAWTNEFNKARVFCYQSGHGKDSYENPNFRSVLSQGIAWAARRL